MEKGEGGLSWVICWWVGEWRGTGIGWVIHTHHQAARDLAVCKGFGVGAGAGAVSERLDSAVGGHACNGFAEIEFATAYGFGDGQLYVIRGWSWHPFGNGSWSTGSSDWVLTNASRLPSKAFTIFSLLEPSALTTSAPSE